MIIMLRIMSGFQGVLIKDGICEVILHPLERMLFSYQRSYFTTLVSVFHDLMESRRDDVVGMDPRSPKQQVV